MTIKCKQVVNVDYISRMEYRGGPILGTDCTLTKWSRYFCHCSGTRHLTIRSRYNKDLLIGISTPLPLVLPLKWSFFYSGIHHVHGSVHLGSAVGPFNSLRECVVGALESWAQFTLLTREF